MNEKLIFVEGLPNAGKSTTLKYLSEILKQQGIENEVLYETDFDNPLDNHCNAYLTRETYDHILELYPKERYQMEGISEDFMEGKLLRYWKYRDRLSKSLMSTLSEYDFYKLPLLQHYRLVDRMWQLFLDRVHKTNKVYLIECALIQNPMHVSLIRDNVSIEAFENRVLDLVNCIKDYDALLIYVDFDDIESLFNNRSRRSEGWQNANLLEYTQGHMYGKSRNLLGQAGLLNAYKDLHSIQKKIYEKIKMDKVILNNTNYNTQCMKSHLRETMKAFLK